MTFDSQYAAIYDGIYSAKDYPFECAFLLKLFQQYNVVPRRLLDFGCGTGGHAVEFAAHGIEVMGVDPSPHMLRSAAWKAQERGVPFFASEVLPVGESFDAIVSLFAALNYLPNRNAVEKTLCQFRELITDAGIIVLDVYNGAAVPFLSDHAREKTVLIDGKKLVRRTQTKIDWVKQRLEVCFECIPEDGDAFRETHLLRYETAAEFTELAQRAGLEVVSILPSFRFEVPTLQDYNLLYVCRRHPSQSERSSLRKQPKNNASN